MNTIAQAVTTALAWNLEKYWEQYLPEGALKKAAVESRLAAGEAGNPYGERGDNFITYMACRYGRHWCL